MRTFEKRTDTVIRKVQTELRCDFCGRIGDPAREWAQDSFDAAETEVRLTTGKRFPEGGDAEVTSFDICPDCFRTKLIPWAKSVGAKSTVTKSDW